MRVPPKAWRGRHRIALTNHCRLAGEVVHPRFAAWDSRMSTILTVNSGYE